MISRPPAYLMFGLDENIQLVWYFLRRGFGGPLLFLWSLGVGIFLLVLGSTLSRGSLDRIGCPHGRASLFFRDSGISV